MKLYLVDGYWWIGLEVGKRLYLLRRAGRQHDCIVP